MGEGICLNIQTVLRYAPPFPCDVMCELTITTGVFSGRVAVLLHECVLRKISGACIDTKSRGIEATSMVSGDRGQPCISSYYEQWQKIYVCR